MYDEKFIIPGLVIFVGIFTFPLWVQMGKAAPVPEPKIDTPVIQAMAEKKCVQSKLYMRTDHMQMLNDWRDEVVREAKRQFVSPEGKEYDKSLQLTCMNCHSNKKDFCDKCHNYAGVAPYCWDCHIQPQEPQAPKETM